MAEVPEKVSVSLDIAEISFPDRAEKAFKSAFWRSFIFALAFFALSIAASFADDTSWDQTFSILGWINVAACGILGAAWKALR